MILSYRLAKKSCPPRHVGQRPLCQKSGGDPHPHALKSHSQSWDV